MKKNKEKASATIQEFLAKFSTAEACLQHLFDTRFGQGHVCPSCNRKAKWYRIEAERAYSCQWCGHHLHPTVGTPFEDSRTPLQLWFYAIYLFTTSRHGVPAKELERQLGVTYKTAWRMADLIRKHMAQIDDEGRCLAMSRLMKPMLAVNTPACVVAARLANPLSLA
jgi:transposase-like protein